MTMLATSPAPPATHRLPSGLLLPSRPRRPAWRAPESERIDRMVRRCLGWPLHGSLSGPLYAPQAAAVAAGWWLAGGVDPLTVVAAYAAKGAASQAASYVNLANPGVYDLTLGVAPTWDAATGWGFNGSAYLRTGIVPASGWSAIVQFTGGATGSGYIFGTNNETGSYFGIRPYGTGVGVWYLNGQYVIVGASVTAGALAIAGQQGYRNGIADGGAINGWSGAPPLPMNIGAATFPSGIGNPYPCTVRSIGFYNTILTQPQVAAIGAAMP